MQSDNLRVNTKNMWREKHPLHRNQHETLLCPGSGGVAVQHRMLEFEKSGREKTFNGRDEGSSIKYVTLEGGEGGPRRCDSL